MPASTPHATQSFQEWVGKTMIAHDDVTTFPLAAFAATLERDAVPGIVPPLWHWFYFLPVTPLSQAGPDGHQKRGGFLPPVELPRRIWAGGRLTFHAPLRMGSHITRQSTIQRIEDKTGRTGRLVFVTVQHRIDADGVACITEEHDIGYREMSSVSLPDTNTGAKQPDRAPTGEAWSQVINADPVLLFRYSALTFNSHRIHYDHPYVTQVEGYPDLVVHGPLIATLLADLVGQHQPERTMTSFSFRAVRPTFSGHPFTVCGTPSADGNSVDLWAKDHNGFLTMRATATLA